MTHDTITIDLGTRSYPIHIGSGLLGDGPEGSSALLRQAVRGKVMVVTNETVAPLYLERTLKALGNTPSSHLILPDGEAHKHLDTVELIYAALLREGFDRGCSIVALGGGVIGDMAGFAAATYQRGIGFVQVPTTLLAQVDSSVGGKTGVNHALGKNMIGAFHQPLAVIADMDTLATLPQRELKAGLAEIIKYGFIVDEPFFAWLESNIDALLKQDPAATATAVQRSCEIKARVVEADEREHGQRALLNFGHTFGHAIEAALGYGTWLHGEAIGAGMVMALDLSRRLELIDAEAEARGVNLLARAGLPLAPPEEIRAEVLLAGMSRDKKVNEGQLRLIVLDAIGQAKVTGDVSHATLQATLSRFTA